MSNNIKYAFIVLGLILILLIFFIINFITESVNKVLYRESKIGALSFELDYSKKRIRLLGNRNLNIQYIPSFLREKKVTSGKWEPIELFITLFTKTTQHRMQHYLNNENEKKIYELNVKVVDDFQANPNMKFRLNINPKNEENKYIINFSWSYHFSVLSKIFKKIYLNWEFNILKQNLTGLFIATDDRYLVSTANLISEIAALIPDRLKGHVFLMKKGTNILIFVSNTGTCNENKNKKIFKSIIKNSLNNAKYIKNVFVLDKSCFLELDEKQMDVLTNYLNLNQKPSENEVEIIEPSIFKEKNFEIFLRSYQHDFDLIHNDNFSIEINDIKEISGSNSDEKIIKLKPLIEFSSSEEIKRNFFYPQLIKKFYTSVERFRTSNSILIIPDYIFSWISNDLIFKSTQISPTLTPGIEITNSRNLEYIRHKISHLNSLNIDVTIKINYIDSSIIKYLTELKINYLIIDEKFAENLNNSHNIIFLNLLIGALKNTNITLIFEKLDLKRFKPILTSKYDKILYTIDKHNL
ncbi:hypothetical protein JN00_0357 [Metamycoplasma subdolum]|uniref:Uncharacterized protein n=1 Tax=Metamycoplasma subdolum TaxID=92407 RepID=A0A3M0A1L0_9BACT|nr:hypothetical protein [Metamycoplasma subdolum]RMA78527.1 hypothetical protein JN00_0357 [Metamycoplasma subdolum]WPB50459.1 hypothetical protein R9C05_02530 [Metamycoplasma subdolum]